MSHRRRNMGRNWQGGGDLRRYRWRGLAGRSPTVIVNISPPITCKGSYRFINPTGQGVTSTLPSHGCEYSPSMSPAYTAWPHTSPYSCWPWRLIYRVPQNMVATDKTSWCHNPQTVTTVKKWKYLAASNFIHPAANDSQVTSKTKNTAHGNHVIFLHDISAQGCLYHFKSLSVCWNQWK